MAELRVFLADDHAVVREGLKALINAQPGMAVVGEAADGLDACEQVPRTAAGRGRHGRLHARADRLAGDRAAAAGVPAGEGAGPDRPRGQGLHPPAPGGRRGRVRAQAGGGRGADPRHPGGGRRRRLPGPDDGRQGRRRVRPAARRGPARGRRS